MIRGQVIAGEGTRIEPDVTLGTEEDGVVIIGKYAIIRSGTVIHSGVTIGNNFESGPNVIIGSGVEIGDNIFIGACSEIGEGCKISNRVSIRNARIGANSSILPGVTIGDSAIVIAGSVVTSDVSAGKIVAGNPAKMYRPR